MLTCFGFRFLSFSFLISETQVYVYYAKAFLESGGNLFVDPFLNDMIPNGINQAFVRLLVGFAYAKPDSAPDTNVPGSCAVCDFLVDAWHNIVSARNTCQGIESCLSSVRPSAGGLQVANIKKKLPQLSITHEPLLPSLALGIKKYPQCLELHKTSSVHRINSNLRFGPR